MSSDKELR